MADHPLRPATHRCLGRPLPHQLANGTQAHPRATACIAEAIFDRTDRRSVVLSGISPPFGELSPTRGQITHVLLTRAPLYSGPEGLFLVRLACVRHAASVRSEPGSNSPVIINCITVPEHSAIQFSKINGGNYRSHTPFVTTIPSCWSLVKRKMFLVFRSKGQWVSNTYTPLPGSCQQKNHQPSANSPSFFFPSPMCTPSHRGRHF